jgi:uncharacterized protein (DUF924 family)
MTSIDREALINNVLDVWLGELSPDGLPNEAHQKRWFVPDADFDAFLAKKLGSSVDAAIRGELDDLAGSTRGALALILLTDQLTRNVGRGTAKAFAGDPIALRTAKSLMDRDRDALRPIEWAFAFMPLMHSESLDDQERSVALFHDLADGASGLVRGVLDAFRQHALSHRNVIARFGRFPTRNAALGRKNTAEEQAFLDRSDG